MAHKVIANNCSDLPYKNKPVENKVYTIEKIILTAAGNLFFILKGVTNKTAKKGDPSIKTHFHYSRFYYNDDRKFVLDYEVVKEWYLEQENNTT